MSAPVRLDAHQHFWRYSPAEYAWIDARMGRIARDFLPPDLAPELARAGLDGCLAVQARTTLEETRTLLELAREHAFVRGVVGWVDLTAPDVERELELLASERALVGLRHIVQAEPDDFLLRPDFQRGIAALHGTGLVYDVLIYPRQLEAARRFIAAFPAQSFVLDHLAKPDIAGGVRAPWERQFRALGAFPNLACKVSGLVTEAAWNTWKPADFRFYLDVALETFGPERLLFGSDWPVCLVAARDYAAVHGLVLAWAAELSPAERELLFGANAARLYRLP
jgi:L-fuconolactonase